MGDFFRWIVDLIIKSKELEKATKEDKSEILGLLKKAIRYTNIHIEATRDTETGEDVVSTDLMEKWIDIASKVRVYDQDLARIFDSKSDYWFHPARFKQQIREGKRSFDYRIRLTEVEKIEEELKRIWF